MTSGPFEPSTHPAHLVRAKALICIGLIAGASAYATEPPASRALIETGRGIYERGLLPDGTPLEGSYPGGARLSGAQAACVTCHRRSGYGSFEGNVLVPPITGAVLSQPGPHFIVPGATPTGADASVPWYRAMTRSPYDASALARAIRQGLDPDGDALMAPMPRYALDDQAVSALFAYLSQLSAAPSPGIEPRRLRLAAVVTSDAPPEPTEAVLGVLQAWAAQQRGEMPWELEVWRLSGPPQGWEAQLEEQYSRQPVFALLSGIGVAEWSPVHRFCEDTGIACILPSLEALPEQALKENGRYALYYSPGVGLEAELLARHLASGAQPGSPDPGATGDAQRGRIVQVFADASGQRAADVLRACAADLAGRVDDRRLRGIAPAAALEGLSDADTLALWLRPPELARLVARSPQGPPAGQVYLSALLAPPGALALPPAWKARVGYVSLYDDWGPQSAYSRTWLRGWLERVGLPTAGDLRPQADAYGACYFFTRALAHMQKEQFLWRGTQLTRDALLESLESAVAKNTGNPVEIAAWTPFYGRLSLGAGQRIAAKGGYILRFASPESDQLIPVETEASP